MSIVFDTVSFSYDGANSVLQDLSAEIPSGSFVLIGGANGAGKSTLLRLLNGLIRPTAGRVLIVASDTRATPTSGLAATVAVTFQNPSDQLFAPTVFKEAVFGPRNLGRQHPEDDARTALNLLGLGEYAGMHPYDLSPALQRLLTVASAVAMGSPFLAFDEPSVGLSQPEREILKSALRTLSKEGRSLIIVSHDFEFFLPLCERVLILAQGGIGFQGSPGEMLDRHRDIRKAGIRLPISVRLAHRARLPLS